AAVVRPRSAPGRPASGAAGRPAAERTEADPRHDELRDGRVVRSGRPRREVEDAELELERVVGRLVETADDASVDRERERARSPVDAVGVELGDIELEGLGPERLG